MTEQQPGTPDAQSETPRTTSDRAAVGASQLVRLQQAEQAMLAALKELSDGVPMPPHDMAAEQCVLGGMMLSEDVIGEVTEAMDAADFYLPAHAVIYQVIVDLFGKGEPTDPVVVLAELERRGEASRVGGAPYLHTLVATAPTAVLRVVDFVDGGVVGGEAGLGVK